MFGPVVILIYDIESGGVTSSVGHLFHGDHRGLKNSFDSKLYHVRDALATIILSRYDSLL